MSPTYPDFPTTYISIFCAGGIKIKICIILYFGLWNPVHALCMPCLASWVPHIGFWALKKQKIRPWGVLFETKGGYHLNKKCSYMLWAKFNSTPTEILKVNKNFSTGRGTKNQKFPKLKKFPSKGGFLKHYPSFTPWLITMASLR